MTVLDLTQVMAGPFCTMILADLGADVIKVENPEAGDQTRRSWGRSENGEDSRAFLALNRNKRSITLDLKSAEGLEQFHRLVRDVDVVVENWRPGVAARLGVDYETLSALNPALVYASISGFGLTGPYANRPGYDLIAQAMSGVMSITGEPDGRPVKSGIPVADLGSGLFCVIGILAAWIASRRTGRGQQVETSLFESALALAVWESTEFWDTGRVPQKLGSANRMSAPYQALATKDGFVTVGANNDRLWRRLCAALDLEHLLHDPQVPHERRPDGTSSRARRRARAASRAAHDGGVGRPPAGGRRSCRAHPGLPAGPRGRPAREGAGDGPARDPPGRRGRAGPRVTLAYRRTTTVHPAARRRCSASTTTRSSTTAEPTSERAVRTERSPGRRATSRSVAPRAPCTSSSRIPRRRNAAHLAHVRPAAGRVRRGGRGRVGAGGGPARRAGEAFAAGTDIRQFVDFASGADGVAYERRIAARPEPRAGPARPAGGSGHRARRRRRPRPRRGVRHPRRDPEASFGVPIAPDLGNCIPAAVVARLQRRLGASRTMAMLLTARSLSASDAAAAGFVSAVLPSPELEDGVRDLVRRVSAGGPLTLAALKEIDRRLAAADVHDEDLLERCYGSADFREGVSAFLEHRRPSGRGVEREHAATNRRAPALLADGRGRPVGLADRGTRRHRPGLRAAGPRSRVGSGAASRHGADAVGRRGSRERPARARTRGEASSVAAVVGWLPFQTRPRHAANWTAATPRLARRTDARRARPARVARTSRPLSHLFRDLAARQPGVGRRPDHARAGGGRARARPRRT